MVYNVSFQVKLWAMRAILQYLYTDRVHIEKDKIDDCIRLARQCKLEDLKTQLEIRLNSIELFGKEEIPRKLYIFSNVCTHLIFPSPH